jgi:uncharacterized protein YukE/uncharacterized coiled-coil protein SlyX
MSNLEEIEAILNDVSGEQYIARVNGKIDTLMQKLRDGDAAVTEEGSAGWGSTNYLKECMQALASTDPVAFDPAITKLSAAALRLGAAQLRDKSIEQLNPGTTAPDKVSDYVAKALKTVAGDGTAEDPGWEGDSAEAFRDNFAKYYVGDGEAVVDQRWLLNSLQLIMEAHRAVYARSRDDLEKLVDKGLEAADKATAYSPGGGVQVLLTVIAAVTSVATAAAAPGAAALSIVAATASAGASIVGLVPDEEPREEQLDTSGTQALFFDLQRVVGTQASDMSTRLERVQDALDSLSNQLSSYNEVRDEIVGPAVTGDHMYGPYLGISPEWGDDFKPPPNST